MWFGIITLFPEMFAAIESGVTGRALRNGLIQVELFNPRKHTTDKHQTVDDRPYGGGPGMLMMAAPLLAAIKEAKQAAKAKPKMIYLSPQGRPFTQQAAQQFCEDQAIILLAGRYEGIDERIIQQEVDEEWSIGDYILTGGELPAMVMIDAITRLLPDTLGDQDSVNQDSLTIGLLKHPQYTRPEVIADHGVPPVLLSGNHKAIMIWRLKQSLGRTWLKRPDLLAQKELTQEEKGLLNEFIIEYNQK